MQRDPLSAPLPSLSVAMCTYNGAAFLPSQIESILRGTVLPDELVVCDDRSPDATIDVLERFRETAPFPVRIFQNPETLRPAQNFARAISLCNCDLIVLSDQDDLWLPDRLEQTRAAFAADPAVAFAYSDAPLIDADGKLLDRTIYSSLPIRPEDARQLEAGGDLLRVLERHSVLCGATMAFRASLRPLVLPVPEGWMHDEWIGLVGSAIGRAARLPRPAMQYRQHAHQQLGVGNWTLGTHLRVARERQGSFYAAEIERLGHGVAAAAVHPELAPVLVPLLSARQSFFRDRLRVQTEGLRGLPGLLRLLFSGRYGRYASGARSALKDLAILLRQLAPGGRKASAS